MSPTLNESTAIQDFKCSTAIEIHGRIIVFTLYMELPHIHTQEVLTTLESRKFLESSSSVLELNIVQYGL